jgi:hypothetical protein
VRCCHNLSVAAIFVVLPGIAVAQVQADEPIKTTLCEVLKNPDRFNNRVVRLRTGIYPGLEDSPTVLFDRSCSAVVALVLPDKAPARDANEFRRLRRYLKKERIVDATVEGIFVQMLVRFGNNATLNSRLTLQRVSAVIAKK